MGPAAEFLAQRLDLGLDRAMLRPPGALPERAFLETCYRCGKCMDACPVSAIHLVEATAADLDGTPYIDPDIQPCVVCDDLACMHVCPSGTLTPVKAAQIRMGLAQWDRASCLRSDGGDCAICVDTCPLGQAAIRLNDAGDVEIASPGCVGCGVCQHTCPTRPRAVRVLPL